MDRRATILEAAHALLLHYGTRKTTMADIAERAGVAVGTLYLEFRSKDSVLRAASSQSYARVINAMASAARQHPDSATNALVAAQRARLSALDQAQAAGRHAVELLQCSRRAVVASRAEFHAHEAALVATIIRRGVETGEFATIDPTLRAQSVVRATMSFVPPWGEGVSYAELVPMLEDMLALITKGLEKRP